MTHEPITTPGGLVLTRAPNENQWSAQRGQFRATYSENPSYCGATWSFGDRTLLHSGRSREDCLAWLDAHRDHTLQALLPSDARERVYRALTAPHGDKVLSEWAEERYRADADAVLAALGIRTDATTPPRGSDW